MGCFEGFLVKGSVRMTIRVAIGMGPLIIGIRFWVILYHKYNTDCSIRACSILSSRPEASAFCDHGM